MADSSEELLCLSENISGQANGATVDNISILM